MFCEYLPDFQVRDRPPCHTTFQFRVYKPLKLFSLSLQWWIILEIFQLCPILRTKISIITSSFFWKTTRKYSFLAQQPKSNSGSCGFVTLCYVRRCIFRIRWSLLGSYVCFTTTSLATVDMYLLLWLCTTCRYHTTVLGTRALEVQECSLWSGCVGLTPALYCAVPQICACDKCHWMVILGA